MPSKLGSSNGRNPSIPVRYRCKVGGEWKPIQAFSKNQQRLIERQLSGSGKVDAANSGMTCLEHSAFPRSEIRCDLCQLVKPYTDFSKSMRRTDDPRKMCKRCTAWTETQEPGVVPSPLETGHVTHEEEEDNKNRKTFNLPADFFPSDTLPQAPITSFSSLGIHDKSSGTSSSGRGPVSDACSLPPHLLTDGLSSWGKSLKSLKSDSGGENDSTEQKRLKAIRDLLSVKGTTTSSMSDTSSQRTAESDGQVSASVVSTDNLPPHLRMRAQKSKSGQVPFVGGFQGSATFRTNAASISTATTMREARDESTYNAWDNSGQRHEIVKSPPERSASSVSNDSAANDVNASDGWTSVPVTKRRGGWHKAPRHQPGGEALNQTSAQRLDFSVDRQRRLNYLPSDDE